MNQNIVDTRTYRKATRSIIDKRTKTNSARCRATKAAKHRRLIFVCSWCTTDDTKSAISSFDNLSHGICEPCKIRTINEPR